MPPQCCQRVFTRGGSSHFACAEAAAISLAGAESASVCGVSSKPFGARARARARARAVSSDVAPARG
eukprot:4129077-Lingulodinium_polyedra.AAC.1